MLFNKDQEGLLDAKPDGVLVIPVNCQGIVEHNVVGRRFKVVLPETYEAYMRMAYLDKLKPGQCHMFKESGQTVALLVFADAEFGKFRERDTDMAEAFHKAVDNMFGETKVFKKYYSGLIKIPNVGKTLMAKVKGPEVTWVIQKD